MLDALDLRVVGALQVDGRASWRRIADVLDEPVRTVSRRGMQLLDDGVVHITALRTTALAALLRVECRPTRMSSVAAELAQRSDVVFVYTTGGGVVQAEVVLAEVGALAEVTAAVGALDGVCRLRTVPVLHYFRTVAEWRPGLLTSAEQAALEDPRTPPEQSRPDQLLDPADEVVLHALVRDGRAPFDVIAGEAGVSEATARRRVDALVHRGAVRIRAVVEPAEIGLPLEALVTVDCGPAVVAEVGASLASSPLVRYCILLLGGGSLLVHVVAAGVDELRAFLTTGGWVELVQGVDCDVVVGVHKRSGSLRPTPGGRAPS